MTTPQTPVQLPDADLKSAAERTRADLGPDGTNYPDVRKLLAFAEAALEAQKAAAPAEHEANTKLMELAERIDHEQLWRLSGIDQMDLPSEKRDRLLAGVELRRYADLLGNDGWRIFPPRPGLSFRAGSLAEAFSMARRDEDRRSPSAKSAAPALSPEVDADCRQTVIWSLMASKGWASGYAEAYVDNWLDGRGAAPAKVLVPTAWDRAVDLANVPAVHDAIATLCEDPTEDNAVCAIQSIVDAHNGLTLGTDGDGGAA